MFVCLLVVLCLAGSDTLANTVLSFFSARMIGNFSLTVRIQHIFSDVGNISCPLFQKL